LNSVIGSQPWSANVWVVAGGPSARSFDVTRMAKDNIILVNDAYKLLTEHQLNTWRVALCSVDPDWIQGHRRMLARHLGEVYVAVDGYPECDGIAGVVYLNRRHEYGLSDDPTHLCTGGNSGYAAVNLAYLKGARTIRMVGFDMDPIDGDKFVEWAPLFKTMLPQLRKKDVRVVNHNRESFITAFTKET